MTHTLVIPAKAGIQLFLHRCCEDSWTPAFAGVTEMVWAEALA